MQDPIRTITLPTLDYGDVTLPDPAWCVGHANHITGRRADILHRGPDVTFRFRGKPVMDACLVQSPFTTINTPELDSPTPGVSVSPVGRTLDPVGLYALAADLDAYADELRDLADELRVILAGGED